MSAIGWGAVVPTGLLGEYTGRVADAAWQRTRDFVVTADELGFDHLWVGDHLEAFPPRADAPTFESFTTLAAISQVTTRVRLGQMVLCAAFRHPSLVAKEAACIDVMSGGRYTLGFGAGWFEKEHAAHGIEFLAPAPRVRAMEETLVAILRLWDEPEVSYEGARVRLRAAHSSPKPVRRPPVWVGTHGRRLGLRVAARFADAVNFSAPLIELIGLRGALRQHCETIGRDFDEVDTTVTRVAAIVESEQEFEHVFGGTPYHAIGRETLERDHLVGPAHRVIEQAQRYVNAGTSQFVLSFPDAHRTDASAERFYGEVIAHAFASSPSPSLAINGSLSDAGTI